MNQLWIEHKKTIGVLALIAGFYGWNILASEGVYDLNDGLQHYMIARHAPAHPHLFLDHWGKPFFTTISAPFAYFGVKGVMFLNLLLTLLTGFLLAQIIKLSGFRGYWLAPVLLAAAPAWFLTTMGPLTEVLFATLFTAGLYLVLRERYLWAAVLMSFLPFARSEAYFIVPLFAGAFLLLKNWKAILLLATGPVLMSVIGYFVFDDILWIIHKNPYTGAKEIYGSGDFFKFFNQLNSITGAVTGYAGLAGAIWWVLRCWKEKIAARTLVFGIAATGLIAVLFAHSWFWYKGLYGSLGLTRVIATVIPAFILMLYWIINLIFNKLNTKISVVILGAAALFTAISLPNFQKLAKKPDPAEKLTIELAEWFEHSSYREQQNVWYMFPPIGLYLNIDQYDSINSQPHYMLNRFLPSNSIRTGGLIIYDGARSPNEGKTSKESLFYDRHLKLVHTIKPPVESKELNDFEFEFLVFEKSPDLSNDTLAYEDFMRFRPIMEGRFKKIQTDENNRKFLELAGMTQFVEIFKFWNQERNWWQSEQYELRLETVHPVEIFVFARFADGTNKQVQVEPGIFSLPQHSSELIEASLGIYSPDPEQPTRVYNWLLKRSDSGAKPGID